MSHIVIAIDIGTSSAKALAVLQDGSVLRTSQKSYSLLYPKSGYVEQNPEVVAQAVLDLIKEMLDSAGTQNLLGICFSSAMHSLMAVDEEGKPLTNLITWADTRSHAFAKKLRHTEKGKKIYQNTGTPIHPMSPLSKLLWIKSEMPELLSKAHKFIGIKEYIFAKLFGEFVIDHSIASATGLFNIHSLNWDANALAAAGISADKLSTPVSTRSSFNTIKPELAQRIGLEKNVPFIIGASDGCLANLGCGAMNKGDLAITIGTSGAVRMSTTEVITDEQGSIFYYRLDEQTFVAGGATNNGATLLNWFNGSFDEKSDSQNFVEEASKIQPGAEGLIFLPYLLGERAPYYNPQAKGVFFGVGPQHTKAHFKRAILEGICFEILSIVNSLKSVGKIKKVMVSGGFIRSAPWIQLLADVLGKDLLVGNENDASALGAAMVGFSAMGMEPKGSWVEHTRKYAYNPENHKLYKEMFPLFENLYVQLEGSFEKLSTISAFKNGQ